MFAVLVEITCKRGECYRENLTPAQGTMLISYNYEL